MASRWNVWVVLVVGCLGMGCCDVPPETAAPGTESPGSESPGFDSQGTPGAPGDATAESATAVEGQDLLGRELARPELDEDFRQRQEDFLAEAKAALAKNPNDLEALIWQGRRTAYLGRYQDAIAVYSRGLEREDLDPQARARLLRHRGHRLLSLRRLDAAQADFEQAAELVQGMQDRVEADGLPNAQNTPTSTLGTNIWYHLGLVHYLKGDFESASAAYRQCMELSKNPDMQAATAYWLYMTLVRLGQGEAAAEVVAPIHEGWELLENHAYHHLILAFKGERDLDALWDEAASQGPAALATTGYGVGFGYFAQGDSEQAMEVWRTVADGESWASFGRIAAEAEVARSGT